MSITLHSRIGEQFGDAHAEFIVHNHHFAAGNQPVIDEDIHRVAGQPVQLNDGPVLQFQHLAQRHAGAA